MPVCAETEHCCGQSCQLRRLALCDLLAQGQHFWQLRLHLCGVSSALAGQTPTDSWRPASGWKALVQNNNVASSQCDVTPCARALHAPSPEGLCIALNAGCVCHGSTLKLYMRSCTSPKFAQWCPGSSGAMLSLMRHATAVVQLHAHELADSVHGGTVKAANGGSLSLSLTHTPTVTDCPASQWGNPA